MELSLCMIIKNEERNIAKAVLSANKIADELIIVDTGSTDNTRRILEDLGKPYFTAEWRDSFAVARNESIAKATKPWVMWMDADDVITDDCAMRINALKEREPDTVFMFTVINVNTEEREDIGCTRWFKHVRMWPNNKGITFVGRLHEQVVGHEDLKHAYMEDVIVEHHGYSLEKHQKDSLRRNIRLQTIDLGFPENTDFFCFEMGPEIFCLYSPSTLAIWYRHIYIASLNPFVHGCPDTHEDCFERMKEAVRDYLRMYADGLRVCKNTGNNKLLADIDAAVKTEDVHVCSFT